MTKILFLTANRLGDAVLSMGVLDHLIRTYPDARITIACGPLPASLFAGVPGLDRVIALRKEKHHRHWIKLWRQVVGTHWDIVVDLRNSAVSRLIRARRRYIFGPHIPKNMHKVAQLSAVIGEPEPHAPRLWITPDQGKFANGILFNKNKVIGIGPTANWQGKIWPTERFMDLIRFLKSEFPAFSDAAVAVFAAPGEETIARQVLESVPEADRIDMIARGDPGQVSAVIARCTLYVGNDSGLMHMAAAAGVRTIGLFGPTNDVEYGPYGKKTHLIRTPESMKDLLARINGDYKNAPCLMTGLTLEAVQEGVGLMLDPKIES